MAEQRFSNADFTQLDPLVSSSLETTGTLVSPVEYGLASSSSQAVPIPVHERGSAPAAVEPAFGRPHSATFSRRRAFVVSACITFIIILLTGVSLWSLARNSTKDQNANQRTAQQDVALKNAALSQLPGELKGDGQSLLVNGDIISRGNFKISRGGKLITLKAGDLKSDQAFTLPDASGTICLDSNNCNFVTQQQLAQLKNTIPLQGGTGVQSISSGSANLVITNLGGANYKIADTAAGSPRVNSLNSQSGNLLLQGTPNQITVNAGVGSFTLSTPQDINTSSSPTFAGLILGGLNCTANANGGALTTNASGQLACSDDDGGAAGAISGSGTNGTIPIFSGAQVIADSIITQSGGIINIGGSLSLSSALGVGSGGTGNNSFTANGVVLGDGTNALITTAAPIAGQILLGNGSGVPVFASLSGDIALSSTGLTTIQPNSVGLGVDTVGNYVDNITSGNGISVTGGSGEATSNTISVVYGNSANTSVQGNTILNCPAGVGNLTGGGNAITLGTGGSCNNLDVVNNPTFSGTLSVQGATITLGTNAVQGSLVLNDGSSNTGSLKTAALGQDTVYTLPDPGGASANICLSTGNCAGAGAGLTGSGTPDKLAKFNAAQDLVDSIITESGGTVTVGGTLAATTLQGDGSGLTNLNATNILSGTLSDTRLSANVTLQGNSFNAANKLVQLDGSAQLPAVSGALLASLNGTSISSGTVIVARGGTGAGTFTANGVLLGNGTSPIGATAVGSNGQCLVSNGGASAPSFQNCTGGAGGGVTSLNGQTGVLSVANATGFGGTITIDDATTAAKGIASFNSSFFTASSGAISLANTSVAASSYGSSTAVPTFTVDAQGRLTAAGTTTLGNAGLVNSSVTINNGSNITGGGLLSLGGNLTINVANSPIFSGTLTVQGASATIGTAAQPGSLILSDGSSNTGTLRTAALGQDTTYTLPDPGGASASICLSTGNCLGAGGGGANTALSNLTGVALNTSLLPGSTSINLGSAAAPFLDLFLGGTATNNFRITGTAAGARVYTLPDVGGNANFCLSTGNCAGAGSGVTGSGAIGTIAKFDASQNITNSIITESGTTITVGGTLTATTLQTAGTTRIDNAGLLQNVTNADASSFFTGGLLGVNRGGTGAGSFTPNGVLIGNGTNAVGVTTVGNSGECLVSNGGGVAPSFQTCTGVGGGVTSLDGLTGALTLANSSGSGSIVTINDATTAAKGIASFNSTNFTAASGAVNLVQNINSTATPTFSGLTLSGLANGVVHSASGVLSSSTVALGSEVSGTLPIANGGTNATTSQGAINNISGLTTEGDILFRNATDTTRLARGTNGQCLTSNTTTIVWGSCQPGGSGVTTVGAIDSQTKSANGAVISGTSIYLQSADATSPGLVSTGSQTFAGAKTFNSNLIVSSGGISVTGNSTIAGTLGSLTGLTSTAATFTAANALTLGTASTNTGAILFKGSGGAGTLTVAGPTTPNAGNFTLSFPAITANANVCTDNSVCTGYAPATAGAYIQQVPANTAQNTIAPTANSVTGLTVNGTSGTAATAVSIVQGGNATALSIASSNTGNLLQVTDTSGSSADVFKIADGGLITLQPAANVNGSLNHVVQTLTVDNTTASSTIRGYQENITISNVTNVATTTIGKEINVTDNATAIANTNTGLKVTMAGSNASQGQIGVDASANKGIGIRGNSSGVPGTSLTCGTNSGQISIGVCGSSTGTNGVGLYGYSSAAGSNLVNSTDGSGVVGYNDANGPGAANSVYTGIRGIATLTNAAAYTTIGSYGKANGGSGATIYGGYFTLGTSGATLGSALLASNSSIAANILQLQDNTTDVFKVADGGLITLQPASNVNGSLNHVVQTLTVDNTTASSTIRGTQQNLTISNVTNVATTNIGTEINVTDNATAIANTNTGLKVTLAGSNASQVQIGVDANVTKGIAIRGISTGDNGPTCATTSSASIGVCGESTSSTAGTGVAGRVISSGSLTSTIFGAGVAGRNDATGSTGQFYFGLKGLAEQGASAAYTSFGVFGRGSGGVGSTIYGGYFDLSTNGATLGSALYASNLTVAANILQLQDNTTDVFKVADQGLLTVAPVALTGLANAESIDANLNLSHSVTFTGGASTSFATQRALVVQAPTYAATTGTLTITDAATQAITGAPVTGTNVALTNTHALLIQTGAVGAATNSYGLTVNTQTGATNNYAAAFLGGNVGIGTASPSSPLHIAAAAPNVATGASQLITGNLTSTTNDQLGLYSKPTVAPASASTRTYYGLYGGPLSSGANVSGAQIIGIAGSPFISGGTVGTSVGGYFQNQTAVGATISNSLGVNIDNPQNAGSITSNVGLQLTAQTAGASNTGISIGQTTGTNHTNLLIGTTSRPAGVYSIYNSSADQNYIAGNLGIGIASPTAILHVSSAGSGSDLFKVTDTTATAQDVLKIADGGAATLRNQTDSTTAFQVQNASGSSLLTVDTTNGQVKISAPNSNPGTSAGVAKLIVTSNWTDSTGDEAQILFGEGASTGFNSGKLYYNGNNNFISFAALGNTGGTTDVLSFGIDGNNVGLANSSAGNLTITNNVAGTAIILKPGTGGNSTAAVQIQNAAGTPIFNVDTTNQRVGIGTASPSAKLQVNGDASGLTAVLKANATTPGDLLQAQDSTGAVLAKIDSVGNLTVKNATINGTLTVNGHIITANSSGTTTIASGAAAQCTGAATVSLSGNDTAGTATITTPGAGTCASGVLATVTFANAFGAAPRVVLTPANADSSTLQYYSNSSTTTAFTIDTNTLTTLSKTYKYNYWIAQ